MRPYLSPSAPYSTVTVKSTWPRPPPLPRLSLTGDPAFGSDFDGTDIPDEMRDVTGLPRLVEALRVRGYNQPDLRKLAHGNWIRVLRQTWGS